MSRRIFMTSLGNSDYKVARYRGLYEGEEIKEGRFFPELRLRQLIQDRHLAFDQVFLLLTREASEAHWSEGGELQHALKALGVSPRVVPITIPQSEQELYKLVEQCSQLFEEGDELYLDITNAFRAIGFVLTSTADLVEITKRVKVMEVAYGAFEAKREELAPIWDMKHIFDISEWSSALKRFERSGDLLPVAELSQGLSVELVGHEPVSVLTQELINLADALSVLNIHYINHHLKEINHVFLSLGDLTPQEGEKNAFKILRILLPKIKDTLSSLSDVFESELDTNASGVSQLPLKLCAWLAERGRLLSSVGLLRESLLGLILHPTSKLYDLSPPMVNSKHHEKLIGSIAYASQNAHELSFYTDPSEELVAFVSWWAELDLEQRKALSKLFNGVGQLRNRILHGWTSKQGRDKAVSYRFHKNPAKRKSLYQGSQEELMLLLKAAKALLKA